MRRVLVVVFLLALGVPVVGDARADDLWTTPIPSSVGVEPFRTTDGFAVTIDVWRPASGSRLCIEALRTTTSGASRTTRYESYCTEDPAARPVGYHFDPTTWSAAATGDLPTRVLTETEHLDANGEWRSIGRNVVAGRLTFGLRWQATGPPQPRVGPPPICYWLCPQYLGVGVRRAAAATGSVHFHGLGIEVQVKPSMPASMLYGT